MAWENRGLGRYFYRKKRIGDSVVSEYIGAGHLGELAAEIDAKKRQAAIAVREALREAQARENLTDAQIDELIAAGQDYVQAVLLASGRRLHKRSEWRRKRGGSTQGNH